MSLENKIDTIFKDYIETLDYIIDNSIPVINWRDVNTNTVYPCVVVKSEPAEVEFGRRDRLFFLNTMIDCITYVQDDKQMATLNELTAAIQEGIFNISRSSESTAAILLHGIFYQLGELDTTENLQTQTINIQTHFERVTT